MRTLAITQNITLNGSIEMQGDWFDPGDQDEELVAETHRQAEHEDALLFGRQTFEDFRGYWPHQVDDPTGYTEELNRVQKYVVSSTMTDPQWENSTVLSGDWVTRVRELKDRPGQDIVCSGSIRLCHGLIEAGLVDEFRLFVFPVVQGRGRRLFPEGPETSRLTCVESRRFGNGAALLRYTVG